MKKFRKKSFYIVPMNFKVSEVMKEKLNEIPNTSEFIREAIQEKLDKEENKCKLSATLEK